LASSPGPCCLCQRTDAGGFDADGVPSEADVEAAHRELVGAGAQDLFGEQELLVRHPHLADDASLPETGQSRWSSLRVLAGSWRIFPVNSR
jgi:hypothetical protein